MKNNLNNYIKFYNEYYEKINKACICIQNNPNQEVLNVVDSFNHQIINSLYKLDWDDSAQAYLMENLKSIVQNVNSIRSSIETDFKTSEELYQLIKENLENLNQKNKEFECIINNKPNRDNFARVIRNEENIVIKTEYPGYSKALADWNIKCFFYDRQCSNLIIQIRANLMNLEKINSISLNESNVATISLNPLISTQLISYNFRNSEYLIINTPNEYSNILHTVGKQKPDKCLHYAYYYANKIFSFSNKEPERATAIGLTSNSKEEILKIAASEIYKGNPVVIQVTGKNKGSDIYSRHFVTIAGIKETANFSNLQESDFLYLDPAAAEIKQLDTDMGEGYVKRTLLSSQNATYSQEEDNEYLISIFSDPNQYETNTCHITEI